MLNWTPSGFVPSYQSTGRTIVDLPNEHCFHRGVIGMRDLRPHFSIRITETGRRTQPLGIGQPQRGSIERLCLVEIGGAAGGFGAVEANLCVRAVADLSPVAKVDAHGSEGTENALT